MLRLEPPGGRRRPANEAVFLTWRLHGTLPFLAKHAESRIPEAAFFALDKALDTAASGPKWLEESAVAQSVIIALRFGERQLNLYNLLAFCVMPNHVHIVMQPMADLPRINHTIRELAARNANQIRRRNGTAFWQDGSYDRWVTGCAETRRIMEYTESDPVAAGLTRTAEDWPWSSASHALNAQSLLAL
jgi:putative transposase